MSDKAKVMIEAIQKDIINRYTIQLKKHKGIKYQAKRLLRAFSIFTIPNGIYHKNEIKYDSK